MMLPERKQRGISYITLVIVLPCKISKSRSETSGMEQMQSDVNLMREGSMKQWKEPESIRAIVERDMESGMSDGTKEIER